MISTVTRPLWLQVLPYAVTSVAVCLLLVGAYTLGQSDMRELLTAKHQGEIAALRADLEGKRAQAEQRARAVEQQRANDLQKVTEDAENAIQIARAHALAAGRVSDGLRKQAKQLALTCGAAASSASASGAGQAASSAGLVLADVFIRADERAGELAAAYDAARAAGIACERAYSVVRGQ